MNSIDVGFLATDGLGFIAAGWDLARRHMTAASQTVAPPEHPAAAPSGAVPARPADRARREAEFAEHRKDGKSVAEAGELVGIAGRTARTYEAKRLAAQNGGRS